jgi:transcriptional regulator with XRE-family HTH domain
MAAARKRQHLTQVEVADRLGVTRTPIQAIERGAGFNRVTGTIRAYAQLVGWTADSPERVLRGEEPVLAAAGQSATPPTPAAAVLPMTVQEELERDAPLVDTEVIQLPDGTSVTVIAKGASKNPTPEERQRNLEVWRRVQTALREISYPTGRDTP